MNLGNSNSGDTVVLEGSRVIKTYKKDPVRAVACIAKLEQIFKFTKVPFPEDISISGTETTFSMPYIEGKSGSDLYKTTEEDTATLAIDALVDSLEKNSTDLPVCTGVFTKKLQSILDSLPEGHWGDRYLRTSVSIVNRAPDILRWPSGPSHGDLTLSNVIVSPDGDVWFIDTLITPTESYLHDIAKLIQEYRYGWSYRVVGDTPSVVPASIWKAQKTYPIQTEIAALVCLCRIVPYVKDDLTKDWLQYSLARQLSYIETIIEERTSEEAMGF